MSIGDHNLDPPDTSAQDHAAEAAHETCEQELQGLADYMRGRLGDFNPQEVLKATRGAADNMTAAFAAALGEGTKVPAEYMDAINSYQEAVEFLIDTLEGD